MSADENTQLDTSKDAPAEAAPSKHERPPQNKQRPSFETFIQMLTEAITRGPTKNQLPTVVRLLKRGFTGEVRPDQANQVVELIKDYSSADRLAVQLTIALPQKPSGIARAVLNRLRSWFAELTGYPGEQADQDRLLDLTHWIVAGNQKPESPRFPADWLRMAFTCLASERDPLVRCEAVYKLLSTIARAAKRDRSGPFSSDSQTFLHEAAQLVSATTIIPRKVAAALQFAHPMEERFRQHEVVAREARSELIDATQKVRTLGEENTKLRQQLELALTRENELRRQSERLAGQVSAEQERTRELEKFWEKKTEQALARQRHELATALAHDLQEARLALDRESPNTGMALNRVRGAEEKLHTIGQNK